MTFYQLWINFKILLFDHIPFRNCLKKPRSVTDSTWPGDIRAVGRSENPGVPVLFCGHNLPPLVEIVLTDPPPAPPGTTGLDINDVYGLFIKTKD